MQEEEDKVKRARYSKSDHNKDSFEGGPSPPSGGCGGGMGQGNFPRVVF